MFLFVFFPADAVVLAFDPKTFDEDDLVEKVEATLDDTNAMKRERNNR